MSGGDRRPLVRAVGVRKLFGQTEVLRGVDLEVLRGEVLCIIGPSGSGKSTFLRCINQLETYQGGKIFVDDELIGYEEVAGRLRPLTNRQVVLQRRRIGMVFQQFNLFWHMTVLENIIEAPVRVLGQPVAQARANAMRLLERVGLGAKADAYPMKLSGGQQQRAAIARALCMEPRAMLFDEPTSALDPEMINEVLDVMVGLAKDGMTMMCVTHEMGFARTVANRVIFMDRGEIVEDAPKDDFFGKPRSERAVQFLSKILHH